MLYYLLQKAYTVAHTLHSNGILSITMTLTYVTDFFSDFRIKLLNGMNKFTYESFIKSYPFPFSSVSDISINAEMDHRNRSCVLRTLRNCTFY